MENDDQSIIYNLGEDDPIVKPNIKNYRDVLETFTRKDQDFYKKVINSAELGTKIQFNQHNQPKTSIDWTRYLIMLLIHGSEEKSSMESNTPIFKCWESKRGDLQGQYYRTSFRSKKIFNYNAVAKAFYGPTEGLDISHLCGNSLCIRPNHLHYESHDINMDRIKCTGILYIKHKDRYIPECCKHNPRCKRVFVVENKAIPSSEYPEKDD